LSGALGVGLPKTLAEIAIDAGLVNKTSAAKAGKMAEEQKEPLVVMLIRELGVDEVQLVGALRKQTRVPLVDPADVQIDGEALRLVPREICARLRILPLAVATDGPTKVMRIAMADPTDEAAIAELEQLVQCEIEVSALPLSAIEELVAKGYRQINTAVVARKSSPTVTAKAPVVGATSTTFAESETSVTAQIPITELRPPAGLTPDEIDQRLTALVAVLVAKGLITEAELAEALKKPKTSG
jgi:type II secretion system (T2SS) protein E